MKCLPRAPMAAALAALILSGCGGGGGKPAEQPHNVTAAIAGFDAFKSGDQAALETQIQALSAQLPADQTTGPFVACTDQGYALRRVARVKRELEVLDLSQAWSVGDDARFVYFQTLIGGADLKLTPERVGGPTDFDCQNADHHDQNVAMDTAETHAIQAAGRDRLKVWFAAVQASLGPQLDPHMQDAAKLLKASGLTDSDRWQAPSSSSN